jgi:hypothetical protein
VRLVWVCQTKLTATADAALGGGWEIPGFWFLKLQLLLKKSRALSGRVFDNKL